MTSRPPIVRIGLFVGVFALVVAAGVGLSGTAESGTPDVDQLTVESFSSEDVVASPPEKSGELSMSNDANDTVVVIDTAHGATIDRDQLAPLANTLTRNGATVKYHVGARQGGQSMNESLRSADAFVVFGAQQAYTDGELEGLEQFTDAGGRVLVMNEPQKASLGSFMFSGSRSARDTVPSPLAPLTSQYGVGFANGYLYNMDEYDTNYRSVSATPAADSALTAGVDRVVLYESVPVVGNESALTTTDQTVLSTTRREDAYGVLTRSDNVVLLGDQSIVSQQFLYRADNEALVGNLLDFLVSGEKSPENAPEPPEEDEEEAGAGGPGPSVPSDPSR